jgi:hypothetical protein
MTKRPKTVQSCRRVSSRLIVHAINDKRGNGAGQKFSSTRTAFTRTKVMGTATELDRSKTMEGIETRRQTISL